MVVIIPAARYETGRGLLDLDGGAGLLELALELLGLVLVDALLDGLGGLVDERLGLLEAQAGGRADDLDDLDLLLAGRLQHDVEGGLLLLGGRAAVGGGAGAGRGGGGNRGRRDAELLLQRLDALGQLEHGDRLQLVDPLLGGGHVWCSSWWSLSGLLGGGGGLVGRLGGDVRRRLGGRRVGGGLPRGGGPRSGPRPGGPPPEPPPRPPGQPAGRAPGEGAPGRGPGR